MTEAAFRIIIAGYDDAAAADEDYKGLKQLSHEANITIDGLVLVHRDAGGKITVKKTGDDDDRVIGGTMFGVVGGFALGLVFPPALIGATIVGGALGALAGDLSRHHEEKGIAEALEGVAPVDTHAVVAVVEARYAERVETALDKAARKAVREADQASAIALKDALREAEKQSK